MRLTIEEYHENRDGQSTVRPVRLKWSPIWHQAPGNALRFHAPGEVDVAEEDTHPVQGAEHSDQADKVAEDLRRILGGVHVRQGCKNASESHSIQWNALSGGPCEEPWCLAISSQSIKGARTNIDVRVGCAYNEDQETPIDNMGKDRNTSKLHRDDERARRGTRALLRPANEEVIGVRDRHAKHQRAEDVEEDDPPQGLADGHADRLARVRRLAKGDTDDLGPRVREASLYHGGPEPEEATSWAVDEVFPKGAGGVPVLEADYLARGLAAHGDDETGQDEHDDHE